MSVEEEFVHLVQEIKRKVVKFNNASYEKVEVEYVSDSTSGQAYVRYNRITWLFSRNNTSTQNSFSIDIFKGRSTFSGKVTPVFLYRLIFTAVKQEAILWSNHNFKVNFVPVTELSDILLTKILLAE